jgi:hypothetical protein
MVLFNNNILKKKICIFLLLSLLSCIIIVLTTPIHEAAHWVMSDIDPFIEPVEIHIFDDSNFIPNKHILSSVLGYVIVREKYPGAFDDRPFWADFLQEIICISIQIIITLIILFRIIAKLNFNYSDIEYYFDLERKEKRVN